jgi:hypothetical protein
VAGQQRIDVLGLVEAAVVGQQLDLADDACAWWSEVVRARFKQLRIEVTFDRSQHPALIRRWLAGRRHQQLDRSRTRRAESVEVGIERAAVVDEVRAHGGGVITEHLPLCLGGFIFAPLACECSCVRRARGTQNIHQREGIVPVQVHQASVG